MYIDDGNFGPFGPKMDNGLSLTFNTASYGLTLVAGQTYRFKYSGENIEGEGETSDEIAILMAQVPTAPTNL